MRRSGDKGMKRKESSQFGVQSSKFLLIPLSPHLLNYIFWIVLWIILSGTSAYADWAFVVLGDSREDFQRDHVFPQMLREINETAYKIKDQEIRPEFLLHLGDFELRWGTRESLERFQERMKGLNVEYFVAKGNHELIESHNTFPIPSIHKAYPFQ
jgi:hypothetical protein